MNGLLRGLAMLATWVFCGTLTVSPAWADPSAYDAAHLLTERTILFLHVHDAREMAGRLRESGLGSAMQDEQVKPLLEQLWGSMAPNLEELEERLGVRLLDLLDQVEGRMTFALINIPARPPAAALFLSEIDQQKLDAIFERLESALQEQGFEASDETIEGVSARVMKKGDGPLDQVIRIDQSGYRMLVTDMDVAGKLMRLQAGDPKQETLEALPAFRSVMSRCTPDAEAADMTWYVDPIGVIRALGRDNPGIATALAVLPSLGVDDLKAIGGRISMGESQYVSISRMQMVLEPPREGVMRMLAFKQGSTEPENWVPAEASQYTTWHLGLNQAYDTMDEIYNMFRGEGAWKREVDRRISEPLGVDFVKDLLPSVTGRVTRATWYEQPVSFNSQSNLVGMELKDGESFRPIFEKMLAKFPETMTKKSFAGVDFYQWTRQEDDQAPGDASAGDAAGEGDDDPAARRRRARRPRPTVAILGDWLIVADRPSALEKAVLTDQGSTPRLRDELDFKLVASKLRQQVPAAPAMLNFDRPEETLRYFYQLLQSEDVVARIREAREENPMMATLDDMMQANKLPPFEVVAQYLAPAGSMMVNEETGLYYVRFGLRRK